VPPKFECQTVEENIFAYVCSYHNSGTDISVCINIDNNIASRTVTTCIWLLITPFIVSKIFTLVDYDDLYHNSSPCYFSCFAMMRSYSVTYVPRCKFSCTVFGWNFVVQIWYWYYRVAQKVSHNNQSSLNRITPAIKTRFFINSTKNNHKNIINLY